MKRSLLSLVLLVSSLQGVHSLEGGRIAELKRALGFVGEDKPLMVPALAISASPSSAVPSRGDYRGIASGKIRNVFRKLRNTEGNEYYTVYFTVPREEIFKKRILAVVGDGLKNKGFKENLDERYQKPLLNYLASFPSSVPIRAYFRPGKLMGAQKKLLREKEKFGDFTQLKKNDFDVINEYNPAALDEVIKLVNDNVSDGFGGQMLVQLSIPKYMADGVVEAFNRGEQEPIDVITRRGAGLDSRLRNSYALVYLQPDANYREMRVVLNDLTDKTVQDKLWDKMNILAIDLVGQVVGTEDGELPSPPIARNKPQVAPAPLPRDGSPMGIRRLPAVPRQRAQERQLPPPPIARNKPQVAPAPLPRDGSPMSVRRLPAVPRQRAQGRQVPPPPIARDTSQVVNNALPGQPGFASLLQEGLRRQAGKPSTAAAMGTNYDDNGLLVWTINNLTDHAVELTNTRGKTIYVEPRTTETLSHKKGFKLDYFWEGPPASKVGENYDVEGTMHVKKHVIDFGWNPRTGLVINTHDIE